MSLAVTVINATFRNFFGLRRTDDDMPDQGAVMFTGVFMACALSGALWFMMGIGDAVLFKELGQESADSSSMAAGSVHARGMNIMAGINLVMLIIVAIYLVLCVIVGIMHIVHIALMSACYYNPYCNGVATAFMSATQVVEKVRDAAKSVMKTTLPILSKVQNATAVVMPHLGQVAGIKAGKKYGNITVSISTSMIPGKDVSLSGSEQSSLGSLTGGGGGVDDMGTDKKLGLPAIQRNFSKLCEAVTVKAANAMTEALGNSPAVKKLENQSIRTGFRRRSTPVTTESLNSAVSSIKDTIVTLFCNEEDKETNANWYASSNPVSLPPWIKKDGDDRDFWASKNDYKGDGPKGVYGPAKNGSDWGQIWTFSLSQLKDETVMSKIEIAKFNFGKKAQTKLPPLPLAYTTETEFFFDCRGTWDKDRCNGDDDIDMSMYSLKWKSRVVRYHSAGDTVAKIIESIIGPFVGLGGGFGGGGGGDITSFMRGKLGGELQNLLRKEGGELAKRLGDRGGVAMSIFDALSGTTSDDKFRAFDALRRAAGSVEGLSPESVTGEVFH
jgi:hypothetical protein